MTSELALKPTEAHHSWLQTNYALVGLSASKAVTARGGSRKVGRVRGPTQRGTPTQRGALPKRAERRVQ